jgi:hypothetical protein
MGWMITVQFSAVVVIFLLIEEPSSFQFHEHQRLFTGDKVVGV